MTHHHINYIEMAACDLAKTEHFFLVFLIGSLSISGQITGHLAAQV